MNEDVNDEENVAVSQAIPHAAVTTMRVGLTSLSRTQRRANMPAGQGFQPAGRVS